MMKQSLVLFATALWLHAAAAFVAPFSVSSRMPTTTTSLDMLDPSAVMLDGSAAALSSSSSHLLLSFTDQGQNLAGIFFQASLLPYLLFLYFLSFRANRIPALGNFGFQFILLFVMSTIPSGILSRSVYQTSLANVDWLHGGAETLLTVANVLIVSFVRACACVRVYLSIRLTRFPPRLRSLDLNKP